MYGNVDAAILWLIILAKYLVRDCNPKGSKEGSYVFFRKYDKGNLELMISVHVENVFMTGKTETLKNIK